MPFVQAGGLKVHYQERGSGPETIVFLHGNIGSWRWWEKVMALLPEEAYHSYAPDTRGCNLSDKPESGHTIRQFAEDLEAFAQALGLDSFTLVGHSLGGGTAMQYAVLSPHRVRRLVLLDPLPATGLQIPAEVHPLFRQWQTDKDALREALKGTAPTCAYDEFFETLVEEAFSASPQVFEGNLRAMAEMDVSRELGSIQAPTLLLWGELDNWCPLDEAKKICEAIPNSRLELVPGVGHSLNVENPEKFVEYVMQFCRM